MPRLNFARMRVHQGLVLWVALCLLLLAGIGSTLVDLGNLPNLESRRANAARQRAIIDPATGRVSLGDANAASGQSFDIDGGTEVPSVENSLVTPPTDAVTEDGQTLPELPGNLPSLRTTPLPHQATEAPSIIDRLVAAPAPEITEKLDGMVIPKRGVGNVPASDIYARHFSRNADQKLLAIVIMDAGVSEQALPIILSLPKEVTLAFSPYTRDVTNVIANARRTGHEAWTMWPMMGERYPHDDPGPYGLVATLPREELMRRLHQLMAIGIGSVGLILPPDETLSRQSDLFLPILVEALGRGLYVLSTHPTRGIEQLVKNRQYQPFLRRVDIALDPVPDEAQIRSKFAALTEAFKEKEMVVATISARPQSLALLERWLKETPPQAPVVLAPLSAIWKKIEEEPKEAPEEKSGGHGKPAEKKPEAEAKSGGHH